MLNEPRWMFSGPLETKTWLVKGWFSLLEVFKPSLQPNVGPLFGCSHKSREIYMISIPISLQSQQINLIALDDCLCKILMNVWCCFYSVFEVKPQIFRLSLLQHHMTFHYFVKLVLTSFFRTWFKENKSLICKHHRNIGDIFTGQKQKLA